MSYMYKERIPLRNAGMFTFIDFAPTILLNKDCITDLKCFKESYAVVKINENYT